jgi:hypothetical protein
MCQRDCWNSFACCHFSSSLLFAHPPALSRCVQEAPRYIPHGLVKPQNTFSIANMADSLLHALPPPQRPLQAQQPRVLRRQSPRVALRPLCAGKLPLTAPRRPQTCDQAAQGRPVLVAAQALC